MLKKPLSNEQMKELVGHYLTDEHGSCKFTITGYKVGMDGVSYIYVLNDFGLTHYSASDLMDSNFRIDSCDGKNVWNDKTEDVLRVVDSLVIDVIEASVSHAKDISSIAFQSKLNCIHEAAKHKIESILSEEYGNK